MGTERLSGAWREGVPRVCGEWVEKAVETEPPPPAALAPSPVGEEGETWPGDTEGLRPSALTEGIEVGGTDFDGTGLGLRARRRVVAARRISIWSVEVVLVGAVGRDVCGDVGAGEPAEEGEEVGDPGLGGEFGEVFVEGEVAGEEGVVLGVEFGEGLG